MKSNKKLDEKTEIINRIRAFEVCFSFIVQFFSQQERQKIFLTLTLFMQLEIKNKLEDNERNLSEIKKRGSF